MKTQTEIEQELIQTMTEYQKLLDEEYENAVRFAAFHGWKSSRVEKGEEFRKKIEQLKKQHGSFSIPPPTR